MIANNLWLEKPKPMNVDDKRITDQIYDCISWPPQNPPPMKRLNIPTQTKCRVRKGMCPLYYAKCWRITK
jgi:hypothetical protein